MSGIEHTPDAIVYAATVIGAGVGVAFEAAAQHRVQNQRESLNESFGHITETHGHSRIKRIGNVLVGPLVILGILGGVANGLAWEGDASPSREIPPQLAVVVDHSGATTLGNGSAVREINEVVQLFNNKVEVNATAFIANSVGGVTETQLSKVPRDIPFGNAPLSQATEDAVNKMNKSSETNGGLTNRADGLLVLTNGNPIGAPSDILKKDTEKAPIFIVNVESSGSKPTTTDQLKEIAKSTHGDYWDANSQNIKQIGKKVKSTLLPETVNNTSSKTNRLPMRVLVAVTTALGFVQLYKKRSTMTLGNDVKD